MNCYTCSDSCHCAGLSIACALSRHSVRDSKTYSCPKSTISFSSAQASTQPIPCLHCSGTQGTDAVWAAWGELCNAASWKETLISIRPLWCTASTTCMPSRTDDVFYEIRSPPPYLQCDEGVQMHRLPKSPLLRVVQPRRPQEELPK